RQPDARRSTRSPFAVSTPRATARPGSSTGSSARPAAHAQPPSAACTPAVPTRLASRRHTAPTGRTREPNTDQPSPSPLIELAEDDRWLAHDYADFVEVRGITRRLLPAPRSA